MDSRRNIKKKSSLSSTSTKRKRQNDVQAVAAVKYLGVRRPAPGRYASRISDQSIKERPWHWLDTFNTTEEQVLAYERSTQSLQGLKARTNFIYSDMPPRSSVTSIISPYDNQTQQFNNLLSVPPDMILNSNFGSSNFSNFGGEKWNQNVQMTMPYDDVELPPLPPHITTSNCYLDNNRFGNSTEFLGSSADSTNQLGQNMNRFSSVPDTFFDGVEEEFVKLMKAYNLVINR